MNKVRFILLLRSGFLLLFSHLQVQENRITAREAFEMACQNNPGLNRAVDQIDIEKSLRGSALDLISPELYYFKEGIDDNAFSRQRWGISQSIALPLTGYYQRRKVSAALDDKTDLNRIDLSGRRSEEKLSFD